MPVVLTEFSFICYPKPFLKQRFEVSAQSLLLPRSPKSSLRNNGEDNFRSCTGPVDFLLCKVISGKITLCLIALRQNPSLWRRVNARNVSFETVTVANHVINSVDKIKLPCSTPPATQHNSFFRNLLLYPLSHFENANQAGAMSLWLCFTTLSLVSEILRHFLYQSDSKLKPIAKSSISFSHVTRESVYSGYLTAGIADDFSGFFRFSKTLKMLN